ncbi:hypothetical protein BGZ97_000968 [Linnemannia gamsii]|uniref:GST N-terminal domain-containing protein n=1 Tax=Linnemannia gamsii TaxID=64522 RepID=A0A9P6RL68_9FUNG|nr:hypothetical protein BGZ97_000968 [Linnemannia gamsii]
MTVPKITLYNAHYCPYAARAVLALAETNQEHDVVELDLSVPRPDWYLKDINPSGQVPALKLGEGHIILESLIVAEYIADLHPESGLIPKDPLQLAQSRYLIHHWGAHTQSALFKATITLDAAESAKARQEVFTELERRQEGVEQEFEQALKDNKNLQRFREWRDAISQRPTVQKASAPREIVIKNYRKFLPKSN